MSLQLAFSCQLGFRGRTPRETLRQTPKKTWGEGATPPNPRSFLNAAKESTLGHWFRNAVFLSASKILQQVWEDENTNDLGLNNASLTWALGQAEVGGQGSLAQ